MKEEQTQALASSGERKQLQIVKRSRKNHVIKNAVFPELIDLVKDHAGNIVYLINSESGPKIESEWIQNGETFVPPKQSVIPFNVVDAKAVLAVKNDEVLFYDIIEYFKKLSYLNDDQYLILANFVFLTYLLDRPEIEYLPIILFSSVPGRGKTRSGKAITSIAYRGQNTIEAKEASIFRYAKYYQSTIFFDVTDFYKTSQKSNAVDMFLARFGKGEIVTRVTLDKGPYEDLTIYNLFSPTIIASNQPVNEAIGSRCIEIILPNMPGVYKNSLPAEAMEIRARLTSWRANNMNHELPEVEKVESINGRLWDISEPLFRVCKLVCPESLEKLIKIIEDIGEEKDVDKSDTIEAEIISIIHERSVALSEANTSHPHPISMITIHSKFNENLPEDHKITIQKLGRKIKLLGIRRDKSSGNSKIPNTAANLKKIFQQYGFSTDHLK